MIARPTQAQQPADHPGSAPRAFPSHYTVAAIAVLAAIFVVGLAPRLDTDLWWHLLAGNYILLHHAVPATDMYSLTMRGHAWIDHEWLTQVMMYALYRAGGTWLPTIFFAGVVTATFALVYLRMADLEVNRLGAAFLLLLGFGAASPILGARPQMVTLLFLAAYAALVPRLINGRRRFALWPIAAIMFFWANMHGGFSLGLLYLAILLAGEWLQWLTGGARAVHRRHMKQLALALGACVAVTLANPYTWHLVLYPFQLLTPNPFTNALNEWSSVDFHMPQMMLFEAMLLLLVASAFTARSRPNWTSILLVLVTTHLALSGARNVAVWVVLVSPILGRSCQDAAVTVRAQLPHLRYRRRPVAAQIGRVLNVALLALTLLACGLVAARFTGPTALASSERETFPARAVTYIRSHQLPHRVFAPYAWGGYVIWKLPGYEDFIDGRANTVFDAATLRDYLHLYSAAPEWRAILGRYGVATVLVEPSAPIAQVLATDPQWRRAYRDSVAVVFTRG